MNWSHHLGVPQAVAILFCLDYKSRLVVVVERYEVLLMYF